MAEDRDIAFCFRGWAYDTGKFGRPKRRVIRINRAHTSKGARAILAADDTTDAGFVINPKEEDIDGVDYRLLAVVVGELLPAMPDYKFFINSLPYHDFDPVFHTLVETKPQTRLVVAIIGQRNCTLHLLHTRRQDGLCEATPLPGERTCDDRVAMRHNVNAFCSEFRRETQEAPQQEAPQQEAPQQPSPSPLLAGHVDHDQAQEASTSEKVFCLISTAISAYETFPCKSYLQRVIDHFGILEHGSLGGISTPEEASIETIRDMMEGKGVPNETKADSVVHAFKELWPYQFEVVGANTINIAAVIALAKGLCIISASGITIREFFYRGVIVSFCTMFSNSDAVYRVAADSLVLSAIKIARGSGPAPMPARPLAQTVDGNPGVALLEALVRDNDARVEQFKAWVETGGQTQIHGGILGQLYEMVQLANVVIGTQDKKAIVKVLGLVKRLVLTSAFATVSKIPIPVDGNIPVFGAVLQAAVHVVAADLVDKFATQADQESDAMDVQPTLPGLPANLVKISDKVSDLYHALGSEKEETARNAASEAIGDYEENQQSEEAPGPSSTLGFPSSLGRKDVTLLRYMRQIFEKENDAPRSQDLEKELAWASGMDWKQ
ncbi:hypothetical protein CEP54_001612 [Fusarium duplospermum]|uniref:Uncharacterized protein n=1 Tax=Fusarium duplospermum TaxID=1325734 RepID=A0A428QZJ8_9HYPO|nr:hypothetical protein CEP54_001612 [Fusarium duplospermum]